MKNYILKLIAITVIIILFLSSCNSNNKNLDNKNNDFINSKLSPIIQKDRLAETSEVILIDTFKTSEIKIVHFVDKVDKSNIYEKRYYNTGEVYIEGRFHNNLRTGKWFSRYKNNVIWSIGNYENGQRHGVSEVFYENGSTRYTENYIHGSRNGISKHYDINENIIAEIMYKNDSIVWQKGEIK